MSWFTDRIGKLGRAGGTAVLDRETDSANSDLASGPALIMLVADASGAASYRVHAYRDTEPAKTFLEYWFPKACDTGVITFWALTGEPDTAPDINVEPMVLVRDAAKPGVIYPFSFVDMDSAQAFARQEVEKGLGLESILIYWAVSVQAEIDDWGDMQMSPLSPPTSTQRKEPHPMQDTTVPTAQLTQADRGLKMPTADAAPFTIFSPHRTAKMFTSPAKEVSMKKPAPRILEEKLELDKAVPEEFGGSVVTNGYRRRKESAIDLEKELLKVLQVKRWETQEGPFRSINSPPGRF